MQQERALRSTPWDASVGHRSKKAQKHIAQDIALGMKANSNHALKGQQNSNYEDNH